MTHTSIRLMHTMTPLDHSTAVRELGCTLRPAAEAAVLFASGQPTREVLR